jgi:hypothetical protein
VETESKMEGQAMFPFESVNEKESIEMAPYHVK